MSDITLNFSSGWTSVQVAKVIANPSTAGIPDTFPYVCKIPHNLGFPPLAIGMGSSSNGFNTMVGIDVDETYIYIEDYDSYWLPLLECAVVYHIDISEPANYDSYYNAVGDVQKDSTNGNIDLRKFLLHSRAVSPMTLNVSCESFTPGDMTMSYTSKLSYPTFQFGYVRGAPATGAFRPGVWKNAPLAGQAYPVLNSNGYVSTLESTLYNGSPVTDKGSIITLRNPAVITNNTVTVNI